MIRCIPTMRPIVGACCLLLLCAFLSQPLAASQRIAVLAFELKDLTPMPETAEELQRTASIQALLQDELTKSGHQIVAIDDKAQAAANVGFGYLFEHHDVAAQLAREHGADYIVVGRLHKPSFLFAYLMVHLVEAKGERLIGDYVTETKGAAKLTRKAVESLSVKINKSLSLAR